MEKKKSHSQFEMEDFVGDNSDLKEVKGEESDASDYDELAPLLPLYNTA